MSDRQFRALVRPIFHAFEPMLAHLRQATPQDAPAPDPASLQHLRDGVIQRIIARGDPRLLEVSKLGLAPTELWCIALVLMACEQAGEPRDPELRGIPRPLPSGMPVEQLERRAAALGGASIELESSARLLRAELLAIEGLGERRRAMLGRALLDAQLARRRERRPALEREPSGAGHGEQEEDRPPHGPEEVDDETPIRDEADLFAACMQLCDLLEDAGRRHFGARRHLLSRCEVDLEDRLGERHPLLARVVAWETAHPDHPRAQLGNKHGLSRSEMLALDLLMHHRVRFGNTRGGLEPATLARLCGLTRPVDLRRLCDLLASEGPLARDGVIAHGEAEVRPLQRKVDLSAAGCAALYGDGVDYRLFDGAASTDDTSERGRRWRGGRGVDDDDDDKHGAWYLHTELDERPLVLPPTQARRLDHAVEAVPLRKRVADELGFRKLLGYGLGTAMLFQGPPGTGKTLAAHVVARRLEMPLLEVSTAQLQSRWVGETEETIQKVFDLAHRKGALLLLDEADSLLQSRANAVRNWEVTQVNTLLRCIEKHEGVVVLTTNFSARLDPALERRLSLVLEFPTPGPAERAQIWRALIGERIALDDDIDLEACGRRWKLTGSQIKSAVLELAMRAVTRETPRVSAADIEAAATELLTDRDASKRPTPGF